MKRIEPDRLMGAIFFAAIIAIVLLGIFGAVRTYGVLPSLVPLASFAAMVAAIYHILGRLD